MKTISANPDLIQIAQDLIAANPMGAYAAMVGVLLAVSFLLRNVF